MVKNTGKISLNYESREQLLQCLSEKKLKFQNKFTKNGTDDIILKKVYIILKKS